MFATKSEVVQFVLFVAVCAMGSWFAVLHPEIWHSGFWYAIAAWVFLGFLGGVIATMMEIDFFPLEKELEEWDNESFGLFFFGLWSWIWPVGFMAAANITHLVTAFAWLTLLQTAVCFVAGANMAAAGTWFTMHFRMERIREERETIEIP